MAHSAARAAAITDCGTTQLAASSPPVGMEPRGAAGVGICDEGVAATTASRSGCAASQPRHRRPSNACRHRARGMSTNGWPAKDAKGWSSEIAGIHPAVVYHFGKIQNRDLRGRCCARRMPEKAAWALAQSRRAFGLKPKLLFRRDSALVVFQTDHYPPGG